LVKVQYSSLDLGDSVYVTGPGGGSAFTVEGLRDGEVFVRGVGDGREAWVPESTVIER
jgi:hypothetical protein